jgi:hypothetical protein
MDGWTDTFASIGARTTGTGAGDFAIIGPGWTGRLPRGVKKIDAPTDSVWLILRMHVKSKSDLNDAFAIQDGFSLKSLSALGNERSPSAFAPSPGVDIRTPPPVQVERMDAITFFRTLAEVMKKSQPHVDDSGTLPKLARLGIKPGEPFDGEGLSAEICAALEAGKNAAHKKVRGGISLFRDTLGGDWVTARVGVYGIDYLKRAGIARVALGANRPEDSIYGIGSVDATGRPLDGSNRYVIHFANNALPPVNAFWSVTVYDAEGYLVENPIGRYALGDQDDLHHNSDGSLDLYVQHEIPDGKESNWLPTPEGSFGLALRLYWPREEILTRKWKAPPVQRVE